MLSHGSLSATASRKSDSIGAGQFSLTRFVSFALVLFFWIGTDLTAAPAWNTSLEAAFAQARSLNRPVYLHIFADWCPVCRRMERTVYPSPTVIPELNQFVTVRINGERNAEIARRFNVRGFPTLVFMDKNGYVIDQISGGMNPEVFSAKLARVRNQAENMEEKILARLEESPNQLMAHFQAGLYYAGTGDPEKGRLHFLKAWVAPDKLNEDKRKEAIYNAAVSSMKLEDHVSAISQWNAFLSVNPGEDPKSINARFYRGISFFNLGMKKEAREDLEFAQKRSSKNEVRGAASRILSDLEKK